MNKIKKIVYGLLKKNRHLPMDFYARIYYEYYNGRKLNLSNPVEFNQKLQWLKVYYHLPILNVLVDKYAVRAYVKEKIGEEYLNELYGVYNKPSDIDYNKLPDQFVIKGTHGSNMNLLVKDKSQLKKVKAKFVMLKWLRDNWYFSGGQEWAYKNVKSRLIIEKYLGELDGRVNDYRFFTFSGEVKFIQVVTWVGTERFICHYDVNWNKLPFYYNVAPPFKGEIEIPASLNKMLIVARKLADKFPFVRVDLYAIRTRVLFGELTFYPADSRKDFIPEEQNRIIGDYIILPSVPEGQNEITCI